LQFAEDSLRFALLPFWFLQSTTSFSLSSVKLKFDVKISPVSHEPAKAGGAIPGAAWRVVEQQCHKLALRESQQEYT
jgi:hypothetical protein